MARVSLIEKTARYLTSLRESWRRGVELQERRPRPREELGVGGLARYKGFIEDEWVKD